MAVVITGDRVDSELAKMDLDIGAFHSAARFGYQAKMACNKYDAPIMRGLTPYGKTTAALRQELVGSGRWVLNNDSNFATVHHVERNIAIVVSGGDEFTGNEFFDPSTASPKGKMTQRAIEYHRGQTFFEDLGPSESELQGRNTWYFLIHYTNSELRSELSYPLGLDASGKISTWRTRIVLPTIAPEARLEIDHESLPVANVKVVRRSPKSNIESEKKRA